MEMTVWKTIDALAILCDSKKSKFFRSPARSLMNISAILLLMEYRPSSGKSHFAVDSDYSAKFVI